MNITLLRPVEGGRVSQWFGGNAAMYARFKLPGHPGIDYAVQTGTRILAAHDGLLEVPPFDADGYGHYVIVRAQGYYTLYAHLAERSPLTAGAIIVACECIGYSGNTGNSTGPHLHFGLRLLRPSWQSQPYRGWVDPWAFRD